MSVRPAFCALCVCVGELCYIDVMCVEPLDGIIDVLLRFDCVGMIEEGHH